MIEGLTREKACLGTGNPRLQFWIVLFQLTPCASGVWNLSKCDGYLIIISTCTAIYFFLACIKCR